jgi:hypothetical protein
MRAETYFILTNEKFCPHRIPMHVDLSRFQEVRSAFPEEFQKGNAELENVARLSAVPLREKETPAHYPGLVKEIARDAVLNAFHRMSFRCQFGRTLKYSQHRQKVPTEASVRKLNGI